ncbi:MAG: 50S ribosomal protein L1 [Candidatus Buchananbacteria bacterium RBG_13_39_9]|uniref:Large ribosomal subunit protein uL1 n=1 Tax=Candidatus Buchananbacteria bacterium RBG_13_39_9 TaxID=1797531 RepID=A0A1G1XPT0_9BACT|nr:MAG: 50S ribosomal protein L1 [Candidatus Buchananbacteria bacterium RBG_13_39_9]
MKRKPKAALHSKRYFELLQKIDKTKAYPLEEAIKLVKDTSSTKFNSTIDLAIRTGIDPAKTEQQIRSTVLLPHGTGKKIRITVIAPPDKQKEAKEAGATKVGGEELIEEIAKKQKIDFDVLITVPEMMKEMAKVAKILGPKGLMPNPKTETVTPNIKKTVEDLMKGKITFRNDDFGNIHLAIGKSSFSEEQLIENFRTFLDLLKKMKPQTVKGDFIKKISISATMGPSIKVQF